MDYFTNLDNEEQQKQIEKIAKLPPKVVAEVWRQAAGVNELLGNKEAAKQNYDDSKVLDDNSTSSSLMNLIGNTGMNFATPAAIYTALSALPINGDYGNNGGIALPETAAMLGGAYLSAKLPEMRAKAGDKEYSDYERALNNEMAVAQVLGNLGAFNQYTDLEDLLKTAAEAINGASD